MYAYRLCLFITSLFFTYFCFFGYFYAFLSFSCILFCCCIDLRRIKLNILSNHTISEATQYCVSVGSVRVRLLFHHYFRLICSVNFNNPVLTHSHSNGHFRICSCLSGHDPYRNREVIMPKYCPVNYFTTRIKIHLSTKISLRRLRDTLWDGQRRREEDRQTERSPALMRSGRSEE